MDREKQIEMMNGIENRLGQYVAKALATPSLKASILQKPEFKKLDLKQLKNKQA